MQNSIAHASLQSPVCLLVPVVPQPSKQHRADMERAAQELEWHCQRSRALCSSRNTSQLPLPITRVVVVLFSWRFYF